MFTPVAPHMTFNRTVVAAPDEPIALRVLPHSGQAAVSIDGQLRGVLDPGDWIGRLRLAAATAAGTTTPDGLLRTAARPLPPHGRTRHRHRRRVRTLLATLRHTPYPRTSSTSEIPQPPGRTSPVGSLLMRNVVILAGGSGTRLWPMSRDDRPKQVLPLAAGQLAAAGGVQPAAADWSSRRTSTCARSVRTRTSSARSCRSSASTTSSASRPAGTPRTPSVSRPPWSRGTIRMRWSRSSDRTT